MSCATSTTTTETTEKVSILDPAMLERMHERVLRCRLAHRMLRGDGCRSSGQEFACIAATVDLRAGDAIVAQRYRLEAEVARGSDLARVKAA